MKTAIPHATWAEVYDEAYRQSFGDFYDCLTAVTLDCIKNVLPPPARIVDFGAGTGRLGIPLAQAGYAVEAVDSCAQMLDVLKANARKEGLSLQTHCCRMQDKFAAEPFDLALCVFTVLLYLLDETALDASFQSAAAALRPDGKLMLDIPSRQIFHSYSSTAPDFVREVRVIPETEVLYRYEETIKIRRGDQWSQYEDSFQIRYWEPSQVSQALDRAGFAIEQDLTAQFAGTGSQYLLARRRVST